MPSLRVLADVTPDQIHQLEFMAEQDRVSRAEIIRRAITAYLKDNRPPISSFFGIWKPSGESDDGAPEDGLAFQDRIRGEW